VKNDAELGEKKFFAYCKENLVKYKRPVEVHFINALPRTGTNKIDRIKLRAIAASGSEDGEGESRG
jgi:acyl-coenzyme A synthetase/AMP-(fatty) acid ligase